MAAAARAEFNSVLNARPLAADEDGFDADAGEWDPLGLNEEEAEEEDETWQKAAWFGWQFLSLRGAKTTAPKTTAALVAAMGDLGPAHRFVGFTRQKADSRGTVHSDGRNYMLSTLTPVDAPEGCGIFVDDEEATIVTGGDAVILDNTYPHYIYNTADRDRICLMSECWHPALAAAERDALATLFIGLLLRRLGLLPLAVALGRLRRCCGRELLRSAHLSRPALLHGAGQDAARMQALGAACVLKLWRAGVARGHSPAALRVPARDAEQFAPT